LEQNIPVPKRKLTTTQIQNKKARGNKKVGNVIEGGITGSVGTFKKGTLYIPRKLLDDNNEKHKNKKGFTKRALSKKMKVHKARRKKW
jgi:hypothetical protein